jgi:VWFA-related protein
MVRGLYWLLLPAAALAQTPPVFEAKVDMVAVDVGVVDPTGKPVRGLRAEDFRVTVDGVPRVVLSADFVDFESQDQPEPPPPSPHFSTNEGTRPGRLVLIAVDQGHISMGNGRAVLQAADRLLDRLNPTDRTGLIAFPRGVSVELTADHGRVREALGKVVGRARRLGERLSISEALAWWEERDSAVQREVEERECPSGMDEADLAQCRVELEGESRQIANEFRERARASLNMLSSIFDGLNTMEGPKTLVLVTEGMGVEDRALLRSVAAMAATARVSVFVLQLDSQLFADASRRGSAPTPTSAGEDEALVTSPLFDLASLTPRHGVPGLGHG